MCVLSPVMPVTARLLSPQSILYLAVEPPTGTVIVWLAESVLHLVINGAMGVSLTVMVTVRVWVPALDS